MEPRTLWQSARASTAVPATATHSISASCVYLVMTKLLFFPTLSLLVQCAARGVSRAFYSDRRRSREGAIRRRKGEGRYNAGSTMHPDGSAAEPVPGDVSSLLRAWSDGDQLALALLTPIVHDELRRLAHHYMRRERAGHSLQTTALVNEAYMRLVDYKRMHWQNRAHFMAVSAQAMRRILVDHARRHNLKRGAGAEHVSLDADAVIVRRSLR